MKTFADQFTLLTDRMLYVGPANSSPPDETALELSENEQDPTTQIVVAVSRSLLPLNRTKWAQIREVQFIVASESFNINIKGMRSWQDIQEDKYRNDDVNGSYVDGDILRPYIAYKRPLCKLTTCPSGAPGDSKGFTGLLESWLERGAEFAASEPDFPIRVVIGDDKCSGGAPCNGPLRPDTRYKYVYEYAIRHIRNKLNWMFKRLCNTGLPFVRFWTEWGFSTIISRPVTTSYRSILWLILGPVLGVLFLLILVALVVAAVFTRQHWLPKARVFAAAATDRVMQRFRRSSTRLVKT